jgi:hypothetical protein
MSENDLTPAQQKIINTLPVDGKAAVVTEADAFLLRSIPKLAAVERRDPSFRASMNHAFYDERRPTYHAALTAAGIAARTSKRRAEWLSSNDAPRLYTEAEVSAREAAAFQRGAEAMKADAVELLAGDKVFHLPERLFTFDEEDGEVPGMSGGCRETDEPKEWCQTAVDLISDTRARAVRALEALPAQEPSNGEG